MEYTLTLRFKNAAEMQEAVSLLSQAPKQRSDKDMGSDVAVKEAGYTPSGERTRLALDALSKCQRVQLSRPAILESWALAFPHVDLASEIAKAEAWAQSKDVKRSPKGWAKALNSWLGKAQDSTRGQIVRVPGPTVASGVVKHLPVDPAVDAWARDPQ